MEHTDAYARFMAKVDTSGDCHLWTGNTDGKRGYGKFYFEGRRIRSHRWLLGYLRGSWLGPDENANHTCDNPPCVNPDHLYVGTQPQNIQDMLVRGRGRSGIRNTEKTHCVNGHEFAAGNTYVGRHGWRQCKTCRRAKLREFRERKAPMCSKGQARRVNDSPGERLRPVSV